MVITTTRMMMHRAMMPPIAMPTISPNSSTTPGIPGSVTDGCTEELAKDTVEEVDVVRMVNEEEEEEEDESVMVAEDAGLAEEVVMEAVGCDLVAEGAAAGSDVLDEDITELELVSISAHIDRQPERKEEKKQI